MLFDAGRAATARNVLSGNAEGYQRKREKEKEKEKISSNSKKHGQIIGATRKISLRRRRRIRAASGSPRR
jgi:hypothetical protein